MVKKLTAAVLALGISGSVLAGGYGHHRHHGHHHHHSHGARWVGPAVAGIVLGAIIANQSRAVVVEQAPTVIYQTPQPQVQVVPSSCQATITSPYTGELENVIVSCHRTVPVPNY